MLLLSLFEFTAKANQKRYTYKICCNQMDKSRSLYFHSEKILLQYDLASKKLSLKDSVLLPDDAENMDASPNEDYTAYTQKFNLFLYHNHQSTQITDDGTRELVYGKSVHREEFGIVKGTSGHRKGTDWLFTVWIKAW